MKLSDEAGKWKIIFEIEIVSSSSWNCGFSPIRTTAAHNFIFNTGTIRILVQVIF